MKANKDVVIKEIHHFEIRKSYKGKTLTIRRNSDACIRRIAAFIRKSIKEDDELPTKQRIDNLFPDDAYQNTENKLLKQAAEIGAKYISQTKSGRWKVEIAKNNAVFSKVYDDLNDALLARAWVLSEIAQNGGSLPHYLIARTRKPKSRRNF